MAAVSTFQLHRAMVKWMLRLLVFVVVFFVIDSIIFSIQSNTAGIVETAFVLVAARNVWKELCLALQVQYINIPILFAKHW